MCAYPSVLSSQLQAQLKRKQQKEESFLICTNITCEREKEKEKCCLGIEDIIYPSLDLCSL